MLSITLYIRFICFWEIYSSKNLYSKLSWHFAKLILLSEHEEAIFVWLFCLKHCLRVWLFTITFLSISFLLVLLEIYQCYFLFSTYFEIPLFFVISLAVSLAEKFSRLFSELSEWRRLRILLTRYFRGL